MLCISLSDVCKHDSIIFRIYQQMFLMWCKQQVSPYEVVSLKGGEETPMMVMMISISWWCQILRCISVNHAVCVCASSSCKLVDVYRHVIVIPVLSVPNERLGPLSFQSYVNTKYLALFQHCCITIVICIQNILRCILVCQSL